MKLWVDAGVEHNGNYGGVQAARICITDGKQTTPLVDEAIGNYTSNEAEILAIKRAVEMGGTLIYSDSRFAVNLLTRRWRGKAPNLKALLFPIPSGVELKWISREENRAGWWLEAIYAT